MLPHMVGQGDRSDSTDIRAVRPPVSVAGAVGIFALTGLVAFILVGVAGAFALRQIGESQAITEAERTSDVLARGVIEPALTDPLLRGNGKAIARVEIVARRVLESDAGNVRRIKIWDERGQILYADEPELIGRVFPLEGGEREALRLGRIESGLADLTKPENVFERKDGALLEVYLPVRTPGGHDLLLETYLRYDSLLSDGRRAWIEFAPVFLVAIVLLWLVQIPVALSMARRLNESRRRREDLLETVIANSDNERRRIVAEVHDGVVQDLVGVAYAADVAADRASEVDTKASLRTIAASTRGTIQRLRSKLVEIYPPDLDTTSLNDAIAQLLAPLEERGIHAFVQTANGVHLPPEIESLFYAASREALRNVLAHAGASEVAITVAAVDGRAVLVVEDDGVGVSADEVARRRNGGHLGLRLVDDLTKAAGGTLHLRPMEPIGTSLRVEVPVP